MWDRGFFINETPFAMNGRMIGIAQAVVRGGILGFALNETPFALNGLAVRTAEALVLCGI